MSLPLSDLSARVVLAAGLPRAVIALLAGAIASLAMQPFGLFPVLALSLPVFVWLLDGAAGESRGAALKAAARIGWCFGFGYFLAGLWWIGQAFLVDADNFAWMMPFAVVLLPAGLALFTALGAVLARWMWSPGPARIAAFAAGLGASEWLRGHVLSGFPWNTFGYALADNAVLGQAAAVLGVEGLTPLTLALFAAPAVLAAGRERAWAIPGLALAALALLAAYGVWRLPAGPVPAQPGVALRIVQPAIPQDDKFRADRAEEILANYFALSNERTSPARAGIDDVTLLVWPESAFPFFLDRAAEVRDRIGALLPPSTVLVTGAARSDSPTGRPKQVWNSIQVLASDGTIVDTYDKVHLVPFGEYLPFQSLLERIGIMQLTKLPGGFASGEGPKVLRVPGGPTLAPLICYEAIFPRGLIAASPRAAAIVNVTNDAWFGLTPGPYQHLAQARVRAVEQGLPLIRAANNGISAVVDPYGRVVASLALGSRGVVDAELPEALPQTLYARYGGVLSWLPLIALFALAFVRPRAAV